MAGNKLATRSSEYDGSASSGESDNAKLKNATARESPAFVSATNSTKQTTGKKPSFGKLGGKGMGD